MSYVKEALINLLKLRFYILITTVIHIYKTRDHPCSTFNFQQNLLYVLSKITTESISHANALYQVHISKLCNTVPNLVGKIIT